MRNAAMAVMLALWSWPCLGQEAAWPDLSQPAPAVGGGEHDAAVVVGIDGYASVAPVLGAEANAKLWQQYLTGTRGVPLRNAGLLTGAEATREGILNAVRQAAQRAEPEGTLWFVFVGHGAPSADGKDGLLVAVDARQNAASLQTHSVKRAELMEALGASRAGAIHVFLDVGFSGRGQDGAMIAPGLQPLVSVSTAGFMDPRLVVLTAAKGDQFAGPLPGTNRPAFSYLALGGLRGWAAEDKHGKVTAGSLWHYTTIVLERTLLGRSQTPDLIGKEGTVLAASASEKGPDLAKLAEGKAGIEWVTMPGGSFMMGADDAGPCAQPRHKVTVKTFQMAKTLVMNKQYRACVEAGVCTPAESYGDNFSGDDQPVVGVNWDQAQAFVKWVGGRLPTEAEWEYAARSGGKKQNYPWGDKEATCERAVIDNGCGRNSTWPVCAKPAGNTKQGLCDMAGNVWEWVQDVYHGSYEGAPADGSAWENSAGSGRVERGGAWYSGVATYARSAYRSLSDPDDRSDYIGFRPARSR